MKQGKFLSALLVISMILMTTPAVFANPLSPTDPTGAGFGTISGDIGTLPDYCFKKGVHASDDIVKKIVLGSDSLVESQPTEADIRDYDQRVADPLPIHPTDRDGDCILNSNDNCPDNYNPGQQDTDGDGIGDACDDFASTDTDGDGIFDEWDNCIFVENTDQLDNDYDGEGDACDSEPFADTDYDGIYDHEDNCIFVPNAMQEDWDGNGLGDMCDAVSFEVCQTLPDYDFDDDGVSEFCEIPPLGKLQNTFLALASSLVNQILTQSSLQYHQMHVLLF